MYDFIRIQWTLGKYSVEQVNKCVVKGYITELQANEIFKIEQIK